MGIVVLCLIIPELRERFIKLLGAGLLALSLVLAVAGKILIKRFEVMVSGQDNFVTDRLGWWSKGLDYLVDSFGVGTGAGGFPKLIDPVPAAHSFYFGTVFEYGIVGIMLFLLIIGLIVWKFVKAMPLIEGDEMRMAFYCLFAVLLVTLVHGLLDFEYAYFPFWMTVALLFSIIKVSMKEKASA
jgi:O-antigen ligase